MNVSEFWIFQTIIVELYSKTLPAGLQFSRYNCDRLQGQRETIMDPI